METHMSMSVAGHRSFRSLTLVALALAITLGIAPALGDQERLSTLSDQQSVAVTIYNQNLALVRDERRVTFRTGLNSVAFRDVSGQINAATALLRSVSSPGALSVLEQNFNYDLLTPQKLLDKYVGKYVTVIHTNAASGRETREQARVLSTNDGLVLQYANRIETGLDGRLSFPSLPSNLRDRPTLVIDLNSTNAAPQDVELSYLTGGLSWKADYVGALSADDTRLDLNGLITLSNDSGTTYSNAKMQLVAGDVNQVQEAFSQAKTLGRAVTADQAQVRQEQLLEYHLYTLGRPTTIADKQTKQVALLSAASIPVTKTLELRGAPYYYTGQYGDLGQRLKFGVYIQFQNEGGGLGIPLPKGTVRIYKKDSAGNAQFVGEDSIDHTPRHEQVRLHLGESFDVTANKKQTSYRLYRQGAEYIYESSYEIEMHNAKNQAQAVKVVEQLPGINWEIISENYQHVKAAADTAIWNIKLGANSKQTLHYTVRVTII
jgi:hypothetical protein